MTVYTPAGGGSTAPLVLHPDPSYPYVQVPFPAGSDSVEMGGNVNTNTCGIWLGPITAGGGLDDGNSGGGTIRFGFTAASSTPGIAMTKTTGYIQFQGIANATGNGTSTNMTALAKGTGGGPTSLAVNTWMPITINGSAGWIPFFT